MDLVFNVIFVPGTVRYLRLAIMRLVEMSDFRYRLVSNGLGESERRQLREFCDAGCFAGDRAESRFEPLGVFQLRERGDLGRPDALDHPWFGLHPNVARCTSHHRRNDASDLMRLVVGRDGSIIRKPAGQGRNPGHGPAHDFQMTVLDTGHAITKGLPKTWLHPTEQLSHGQHGPAKNLGTQSRKVLLYNYCQLWVRTYDGDALPHVGQKCTARQRRLLGDLGYDFRPGSYFYVPRDQNDVILNATN